ncbi:B12-binding domain-containing radical SAM protein [Desulfomonile tiedjei]|uniref:Fe-S oxidoreductase n=1 Tax=Desulfomonile tiedjei (strain ATCC 49306 / DSM 6799 / DCB-1) TaxID=706587 RepID=I4C2F2_DESTA|nr:B12-binding domain-containing radical SAM protein [Desulfomonile tiedjei]AFM23743.1 Fe-S oxidoreductase [Desulfomonile tiedjei DSM 6799]
MSVFIINEPYVKDFNRTQRWAARTRGRVLRAPDWLAYATAVLEREGIPVKLFDFPARDWDKDRLRRLVNEQRPDFVVLDSTTPSIYSDIECARMCKEAGATVLMVGPHASARPEETIELADGAVDAICIGEYDYTVLDVVKNYPHLETVNGICFLDRGKPKRTVFRPLIEDLDSLPFPAWHHLDLLRYFDGSKLYPYVDIFSGRGCPHSCTFCLWPQVMHGRKVRLRSPENVVDEMERDIALCPKVVQGGEFFFEDDTFTLIKSNAVAICEEIVKRGLKVKFSVNARTDTADEELFRILKAAGCRELLVGFESGDSNVLTHMQKRESVDDARRFMELAHKTKLDVHGCFVIGLPGETEDSIGKTIDMALGLGLHTVQFSGAVPFPGTRYFDYCKENGLLKTEQWDLWLEDGEQAAVVDYPGLSRDRVKQAVDEGLKKFYFRPSYMLKFLFQTRSMSDLYRKLRGARNFLSYLWNERRAT